jgi:hypothetical protein
VKWESKP